MSKCCDTIGPIAPRYNKDPDKKWEDASWNLTVQPERWRFIMYCCFWGMCTFAIAMNKIFVKPRLLAGPPDGSTCPPFERDNPELGVSPGKGFDVDTQSHLIQLFGYSNICVNWDYTPSRELTSLVYPALEYSFCIYLALNFVADSLANARGDLSPWVWSMSKILFPIKFILCSQFRTIFVFIAYFQNRLHTIGFLGLQIGFILIALENAIVVWDLKIGYPFFDFMCGGAEKRVENTRKAMLLYIILHASISGYGVYLTSTYVFTGIPPAIFFWEPVEGITFLQGLDFFWMILNMIIPMAIAYKRAKADYPLQIRIGQKVKYDGENDSETKPLKTGN